jgi:uncharacterized protein (DUF885 family)
VTLLDDATRLTRRYRDAVVAHQPVEATVLGDRSRDRDLPDLSPQAVDEWARVVSGLLREVAVAEARLPAEPRGDDREAAGDLSLLRLALESQRFWLEDRPRLLTDPLAAVGTASSGIHELLRRTDLDEEAQRRLVDAAAARARRLPRLLEQAGLLLETSPAPHLEVALTRLDGLLRLVRRDLPARTEALRGDVLAARDAAEVAAEAVEAFAALLTELAEQQPAPWRLGPDHHARALRLALGSDMPPDEVERRARAWLAEVREAMVADAVALLSDRGVEVPASSDARLAAALDLLCRDVVDRDGLMAAAAGAVRTTHDWAAGHGFVDLPPSHLLTVTEAPAFLQGVAVAFITSPPAEDPDSGCTYYLSPVPAAWDDARAGSFLAEYNRHALHSLALHEAVPGHWVQLEHAARHPRLSRRWLWSSAFAEGWAVHIERVAVDLGFGDDVPGVDGPAYRLSQRKLELRLAANALLDVGLHAGDLDDEAAMSLLVDETFQQSAEAAGKLRRAKVTSGQLCSYFVGGEELRDLETDERRRLGAGFDRHGFDQRVLSHGTPTTAIVRAALADPTGAVERRPFARSGSALPRH